MNQQTEKLVMSAPMSQTCARILLTMIRFYHSEAQYIPRDQELGGLVHCSSRTVRRYRRELLGADILIDDRGLLKIHFEVIQSIDMAKFALLALKRLLTSKVGLPVEVLEAGLFSDLYPGASRETAPAEDLRVISQLITNMYGAEYLISTPDNLTGIGPRLIYEETHIRLWATIEPEQLVALTR